MSRESAESANVTLGFEEFWGWLQAHPNCIIRAGTPEAILYDDEDLHWHFTAEGPETFVVQLIRGKRLLGELLLIPSEVTYVQGLPGEEQEHLFELVSEAEDERMVAYHFVLAHGYDEAAVPPGRAVH